MNTKQDAADNPQYNLYLDFDRWKRFLNSTRVKPIIDTVIKELFMTSALLFGVSLVAFTILFLAPGDPFASLFGDDGASKSGFFSHYFNWLFNMVQGDFGTSIRSGEAVLPSVMEGTGNTLSLTLASILLALVIAYPIGLIVALRQETLINTPLSVLAYVISSLPIFWLGYIAVYVSTNYFDYFPLASSFSDGDEFMLVKFLFPVLVLGLGSGMISEIVRHVRLEVSRIMEEEYIRTAKAKGASVWRHALKEAFILPVTDIIATKIPFFIGGAIIVEQIFNWHGMGRMAWQAAQDRDFPVILCITLVAALLVRGASLVQRIIYISINPRASHE